MQNRYVGDIGDFAKYSLLIAIAGRKSLGVAWYLFPDESHNDDGRHVNYLSRPDLWRSAAPDVFDRLGKLVRSGTRNVDAVIANGVIKPTATSDEFLICRKSRFSERAEWRKKWFERSKQALAECDAVFLDPDNGLCEESKFRYGRVMDWKRLPINEVDQLAEGRLAVVYHHNSRFKGGHAVENDYWMDRLNGCSFWIRFRAYSSRTFFVLNGCGETLEKAAFWADRFGDKAELVLARC